MELFYIRIKDKKQKTYHTINRKTKNLSNLNEKHWIWEEIKQIAPVKHIQTKKKGV